jgi:hypothetical protein
MSMTQFLSVLEHLPNPRQSMENQKIRIHIQDEGTWFLPPTNMYLTQYSGNKPIEITGSVVQLQEIEFTLMMDKFIPYWKPTEEITIY